ncbi:hypothetical protein VSS26_15235 [Klebsiella pneumoniae]|uniref:hypothetical protein n=1 Tax=Klebsiella pneumoniae TaxID=573 RepID=UPI002DBA31A5|nr:hypothetical protein [Klebsiella pneumoniae]MEC4329880.1 hypothetical protein [Klebsiella pneumoniae]HDO6728982.1 hypothetical protein [Klebsiella pneumoniae]
MDKKHFSSLLQMKEMNKRLSSVIYHTDQLSAVLVHHMVCEKVLETWIEASTHNKEFFCNSVSLTFNNKLLIAKNFSLPNECFLFMRALNSIRNKFAHQIEKTEVSESEIEMLYSSLSGFINRYPSKDPKLCKIITKQGTYTFNDSNNIKISLIFSSLFLSLFESSGLVKLS